MTRLPIFLIILSVLLALVVAGGSRVVRSRRVDVLLVVSMALASVCVAVGGLFVVGDSPERSSAGAVLFAGGAVSLSVCSAALALWVRSDGKA